MASVTPESPLSELFERAAKVVQRSQKLCAATGRLIEEARHAIATIRDTDRRLETALRERNRARARPAMPTGGGRSK